MQEIRLLYVFSLRSAVVFAAALCLTLTALSSFNFLFFSCYTTKFHAVDDTSELQMKQAELEKSLSNCLDEERDAKHQMSTGAVLVFLLFALVLVALFSLYSKPCE